MKLGLCLAGGGVKGAAHIGVLKALEEENIKIDYISGASSGSIVATLYAVGYTPEEIYGVFKSYCKNLAKIGIKNILKLIIGLILERRIVIDGLNDGKKISKIINEMCEIKNVNNISEIKTPLIIPSVDLYNGMLYIFSSKQNRKPYSDDVKYVYNIDIGTAVQASCAYPGVFSPCAYEDTELIDGGIRENIPWRETKQNGADVTISVVFEKELNDKKCKNIVEVITTSIDILSHELSVYELTGADCLIKIAMPPISLLDTKKIDYLFSRGYEETMKNIENIKRCLEEKNKQELF